MITRNGDTISFQAKSELNELLAQEKKIKKECRGDEKLRAEKMSAYLMSFKQEK